MPSQTSSFTAVHNGLRTQSDGYQPDPTAAQSQRHQRWCIFTAAGDNNAVRLWLQGDLPRRWDLIVAYYGDNDEEFSELARMSSHAFRTKGGKFEILRNVLLENAQIFDQYSYVWACDDDIRMTAAQIDEAFAITEFYKFWVAQPAFLPEGKNSHPVTIYPGPQSDYRLVNFIECGAAIFRREKLTEFMKSYDGSLAGYGTDYWYMNLFGANSLNRFANLFRAGELGRFAIIDKVQVVNPHDEEKGGRREIDRLQPAPLREAAWIEAQIKYGLVEFRHKVFASCEMASHPEPGVPVTGWDVARQIQAEFFRKVRRRLGIGA